MSNPKRLGFACIEHAIYELPQFKELSYTESGVLLEFISFTLQRQRMPSISDPRVKPQAFANSDLSRPVNPTTFTKTLDKLTALGFVRRAGVEREVERVNSKTGKTYTRRVWDNGHTAEQVRRGYYPKTELVVGPTLRALAKEEGHRREFRAPVAAAPVYNKTARVKDADNSPHKMHHCHEMATVSPSPVATKWQLSSYPDMKKTPPTPQAVEADQTGGVAAHGGLEDEVLAYLVADGRARANEKGRQAVRAACAVLGGDSSRVWAVAREVVADLTVDWTDLCLPERAAKAARKRWQGCRNEDKNGDSKTVASGGFVINLAALRRAHPGLSNGELADLVEARQNRSGGANGAVAG